jgi:hypothetical protein
VAMTLDMPARRWKFQNPQKLKTSNPRKFQQEAAALRERLGAYRVDFGINASRYLNSK